LITMGSGILGSLVTTTRGWYGTLNKPSFNPPGWVFGPVWTILYLMMGISLYLVWMSNSKLKNIALIVFAAQLVLNAIWSPLFFGLHSPLLAFIDIVLMWVAIIATIYFFYQVSRPAAYLLIPYLFWVSFAAFLNLSIYRLN